MIKVNQVRAARALLGWHQKDLARMAGISELSVVNLENSKTTPQKATLEKIAAAFELAGVGFTPNKVEMKDNSFTVLSGEDWFVRILDDVEKTFETAPPSVKREYIAFHANEGRSNPPATKQRIRDMAARGIEARIFIKEGVSYIEGNFPRYRYVPKKHFDDNGLAVCYGDKIAILLHGEGEIKVNIFRNAELASTIQSLADLLWDKLPQPKTTTAPAEYRY